jgi:hypothetical protein
MCLFYVILLFFLSPKYNVFHSKNLKNNRVQYYLHHGIFRFFLEYLYFFVPSLAWIGAHYDLCIQGSSCYHRFLDLSTRGMVMA